jgi:hypothetical protein
MHIVTGRTVFTRLSPRLRDVRMWEEMDLFKTGAA